MKRTTTKKTASTAIAKATTTPSTAAVLASVRDLATALELTRSVTDVREIRDRSKAAHALLRARGVGLDGLVDATEVTLRSERRLGQFCAEAVVRGRRSERSQREAVSLEELGITKIQSHRWQLLADIPSKDFEDQLANARKNKERITVASLLELARGASKPRGETIEAKADESWLDDELAKHGWTISAAQRAVIIERGRGYGARVALDLLRAIMWSQWDTDAWLAKKMVELAELHAGARVLEPSAGTGAICRAIHDANPRAMITAHEIDPVRVKQLRALERQGVIHRIVPGDFFKTSHYGWSRRGAPFDASIQNTAYEHGLDGLFLERVMRCCDRVVALLRTNALHGFDRHERVWSRCTKSAHLDDDKRFHTAPWGVQAIRYLRTRPAFESVIAEGGARSDFVVIRLDRGYRGKADLDWWTTEIEERANKTEGA